MTDEVVDKPAEQQAVSEGAAVLQFRLHKLPPPPQRTKEEEEAHAKQLETFAARQQRMAKDRAANNDRVKSQFGLKPKGRK